jgi:long-chain acyl-CoA synthetase
MALPRRRAAPASRSRAIVPEEAGCSLLTVPLHRSWGPVQFWAALDAGRAIAFMRRFDPLLALRAIERRHVTHWSTLPTAARQIAALPDHVVGTCDLSSMRDLTVGGATVGWPLKMRLADIFGPVVSEAYGSTEAGVIALMPPQSQPCKPGSCGKPLRGVVVEIRDAHGRPLPPNATGEIWARTPRSLACELIGPHSRRDADGFVATADLGRLDEDGFLFVIGRTSASSPIVVRRAG